jgi:ATP-dependent Clp protease ATP-binding subunit ClpC
VPEPDSRDSTIRHDRLDTLVARLVSMIERQPRRSVVLVGERGVGKTVLSRAVARRMTDRGWVVWQAGHKELIAGMVYIGELEQRMRKLLEKLDGRKVLWLVEDFHALALSGKHKYGPMSVLDYLLPRMESGDIVLVGETTPRSFERLVQSKPRVLTAMETVRVTPLTERSTHRLVDRWAEAHRLVNGEPVLDAATRREAWLLAEQYLGDWAAPGNVLSLLDLTRQRCVAGAATEEVQLRVDDLIATLAQLTGLPATVLDERQGLNLDELRRHFESRVKGQREAIDALVERVAMIKAGVTDPTRPFGVFLFAGPTGTGKTEVAKTLASFLFGSPDRMIRLDMSEFKDPESIQRLIGGVPSETEHEALVDRIRKQPFSVVLLDEFEKAHPNIWDLFLQVFDDGRLTDRSGNTADFRSAIIILTSNLGSRIPAGSGLGFSDETGRFNESTVHRVVKTSFRPEFLNRLDRVIVFRPLERDTMRQILRKELGDAFKRRGLRNRDWAVEWDESALEFLLERGFTADLGARPLKRAIERHVLAPLAETLVDHRYPEGDQFVFVRAGADRLVAEFVDPDAPDEPSEPDTEPAIDPETAPPLCRVALDPKGRPEEMATLRLVHGRLCATVTEEPWQRSKSDGLERIGQPDFWNSASRFRILGRVEYLDRIEAGVKSAGSLLDRLSQGSSTRSRYPRDLLGRVAAQLYLLDAACRGVEEQRPRDAFLSVEAWTETGVSSDPSGDFARRIGRMYRAWAERRRMQCEVLRESGPGAGAYRLLLSLSGFAAYPILEHEHGLHLLETPGSDGKKGRKYAARVRVAAQPEEPPPRGTTLGQQARAVLSAQDDESLSIVRRYRIEPSPLVRDMARGWRSGKLDRVFGGDFDLLGEERVDTRTAGA